MRSATRVAGVYGILVTGLLAVGNGQLSRDAIQENLLRSENRVPTSTKPALEPSASHAPLGEYVACLFSEPEKIDLHALSQASSASKTIDDSTAIELYAATVAAITQFSSQPGSNSKSVQDFLAMYSSKVSPEALAHQTPAAAYTLINNAAQSASQTIQQNKEFIVPRPPTVQEEEAAATAMMQAAIDSTTLLIQQSAAQKTTAISADLASTLYNQARTAIVLAANQKNVKSKALQDFLSKFSSYAGSVNLGGKSPDRARSMIGRAAVEAKNELLNLNEAILSPVLTAGETPSPADIQLIDQAANSVLQHVTAAASNVIESKSAKPFLAPEDVSCSMSILGWKETSDIFGRRVANSYIAIQVTVRNLNSKNEFLIHDIQIAIDTGLDQSQFGRFQAGRDKLLVRGVAQRGQSEDRRNLILHTLEAMGALAGSSSIAGSSDFKSGVAVFQGALIPGFSNIFPDHTVEQLNHINDLAFSASSTSKVLVPIQGSVPLVTFISERPVGQLPFAWCGYTKPPGLIRRPAMYCDETAVESPADSDSKSRTWDSLDFRKWKPLALETLEKRTFVVIGGVHIQELQALPKTTNLDCPTLPSGSLDLSQTQDGAFACSLSGTNLDRVSSIALEKGADRIVGKLKPAKDGNSATITLDIASLSDLSGIYSLFFVDKAGTETDSGESVVLSLQPIVTKLEEAAIDLSQANAKLTIDGKHFELLAKVVLVPDEASSSPVAGSIPNGLSATDKTAALSFVSKDLVAGKQYHLEYATKSDPAKLNPRKDLRIKPSKSSSGAGGN